MLSPVAARAGYFLLTLNQSLVLLTAMPAAAGRQAAADSQ
jgi:hypothetical protein